MCGAASFSRGGGIRRRSNEWMPEARSRPDLEQAFVRCRCRRVASEAQRLRCAPKHRGVPGGVGGCQRHQLPCLRWQVFDTLHVVIV
jgi:hypothetical protein